MPIDRADVLNEDIELLKVFFNLLGPEVRKNACLIITHCESKSENERDDFLELTKRNLDLKLLTSQMKQDVFFTGSIHRDDWQKSSENVFNNVKR